MTRQTLLIPENCTTTARGRDLLASFDRVVKSGTPELVLVSGYSGIGKSSVVNELHKALVGRRPVRIRQVDQYKRTSLFHARQAFQSSSGLLAKSEADLVLA